MAKNQKGFSVVELMILLVVIVIIGFVGWYIWMRNGVLSQPSTLENKTTGKNTQNTPKQISLQIPAGWLAYENNMLGVGFAYPKNWTFKEASGAMSSSTRSRNLGELTLDDKDTSVLITLVRKKDERRTRSSINEWKIYAEKAKIMYSGLTPVDSKYIAFRYIFDANGAIGLVYEILEQNNNVHLLVLPSNTSQKDILDQFVNTFRFAE